MKLFDLHCDTVSECMPAGLDLYNTKTQLNLSALEQFESWVQVMALFIPDELRNQQAVMYYDKLMTYTNSLLIKHRDKLYPVLKGKDLYDIPKGYCGIIKAIEGGAALSGQIQRINYVYHQGVRIITLTWNGENELGSGALCNPDKGLTEFGREAVAEMEKVGILVDASHLSRRSFWDLCETASKPFVCTHSDSDAVCNHNRNLTDEQFKEIIRRKGLAGINLYKDFLSKRSDGGTVDDVIKHIYHFLELGGEDIIAIGSDFDGADIHQSLNSPIKLAIIAQTMLKLNFKQEVIDKIMYKNAFNFFASNI